MNESQARSLRTVPNRQSPVRWTEHVGTSTRVNTEIHLAVIGDRQLRATRYTFITPYLAGSIWYDDEKLWVRGEFERDGSKIQYQLDT